MSAVLLVGGLPGGSAAQQCTVAVSGGGGRLVAHNTETRLHGTAFVGLDFGCTMGRLHVGVAWDQHGRSHGSAWFFNDLVAIDGLLGRVGREFFIGGGRRAPWVELAALAGPAWAREVNVLAILPPPESPYDNPGFAGGGAVRIGVRPTPALSVFLESGVRYNRVGIRSGGLAAPLNESLWLLTIPVGAGVRWSF